MFSKKRNKYLVIILILIAIYFFKFAKHYPQDINLIAPDNFWGLTFSTKYSRELNLKPLEVYQAILEDLNIKNIRLPIYWDEIEKEEGVFDFTVFDELIALGEDYDINYIINIGWRLPRWPECHAPQWSEGQEKEKTLLMLKEVINHYKDNDNIIAWQIENEPLLNTFGICPNGNEGFLRKEIDLVKSLDQRDIIISASGELSSWKREGKLGDIFGTTMYRVVYTPFFGYFKYPLPASFYSYKAQFNNIERKIISELQLEPWVPNDNGITNLEKEEKDKSLNLEQMKANLQFAINTNFSQAYLWGVEWWYYEKVNNNPIFWDLIKELE